MKNYLLYSSLCRYTSVMPALTEYDIRWFISLYRISGSTLHRQIISWQSMDHSKDNAGGHATGDYSSVWHVPTLHSLHKQWECGSNEPVYQVVLNSTQLFPYTSRYRRGKETKRLSLQTWRYHLISLHLGGAIVFSSFWSVHRSCSLLGLTPKMARQQHISVCPQSGRPPGMN